jgi:methylmalonyl-CoA/ethylmalonyl-CoA epimerase
MNPSAMASRTLDHVGVAVHSIAESARVFELLSGEACTPVETLSSQGVRVAFVGPIELLEPTEPDTAIGRFLHRRGQGLHHVAYRTGSIESDLAALETAGLTLIDRVPRPGARGHRVAFIHPTSSGGVLVELVEHPV